MSKPTVVMNTAVTSLLNQIRKNVSRDRTRFEDEKYNLDLTYITSRIIAMAFPASGLEAAWRNHIDDVSNMLNEYHRNHYRIWNLSERKYDYNKFDNQMLEFGFPDHHSPPLTLLCNIIISMHDFLISDRLNVAAIHCVGGKGRTGTVICAFLVFVGRCQTADEAFDYFASKRSAKDKGVTQPCQKRYVRYFHEVLTIGKPPRPKTLLLTKIVMKGIPGIAKGNTGCNPAIRVFLQSKYPKTCIHATTPKGSPAKFVSKTDESVTWVMECPVKGDILLKCAHVGKHRTLHMFRYAFHTAFIADVVHRDYVLVLRPEDLDDFRIDTIRKEKADKRGTKTDDNCANFFLMLVFSPMNDNVRRAEDNAPLDDATLGTYERIFVKRGSLKGRPLEMEDEFHPSAPDSPASNSRDSSAGSHSSSSSFSSSGSSSSEGRPLAISEPVLVSATNVSQLPGVSLLQEQLKQQQQLQNQRSKSPTVTQTPPPYSTPSASPLSASPQRPPAASTAHLAPPPSSYMRRQTSSPSLNNSNNDNRQPSPQQYRHPLPTVPAGYSTLRPTRPSASSSPTPTRAPVPAPAADSRSPAPVSPGPVSPALGRAALSNYNRPPSNSSPVAPAQMVLEGLAAPAPARLRRQSMTIAKMSSSAPEHGATEGDDNSDLPSYLRPHARTLMQPDPRRLTSASPIDTSQRASTSFHIDRTRRMQPPSAASTTAASTSNSSGSPDKSS